MATTFRNEWRNVMSLAWQFVKRNGYTMSEALKCAWANIKLRAALNKRIVKFYFQKVNGEIREAYGTLKTELIPETKGDDRKRNDSVQVYFDTEKSEYRCFKKANLIRIA
ncbi:SH3 beta-barrel fold-containing protein [Hoylesella buccalis]|uniref:SH3 beta-barrel fold-containing protein n=1 Tax=Hoylesella buccalis TaxID=28127 RepID=UPI00058C8FBD|nr:SH3 beta-barrel fold-containing protein [Hoylesella buccalis]